MADRKPEIYVYKVVVDNGGAPCVSAGVLSLAICKPKIRKSCGKNSLIFGFGGKDYGERLIYIARVTQRLEDGKYYQERVYAKRGDCIYRSENDKAVRKQTARYHRDSDHRRKDVGLRFENAFVVLSDDFRYLGNKGSAYYKKRYPKLRKLIENLKQGHRRYHSPELREELMTLKTEVWRKHRRMKVGTPMERDRSRQCNLESASANC